MGHNASLPTFRLDSLMAYARDAPQREKLTQGIEGALRGRHVSHGKISLWLERRRSMKESSVVRSDSNILGGTPVFVGTRVPVGALIDYIEGGHSLSEFLDDFPTVSREVVIAALKLAKAPLIADARAAFHG
jgi:uncharacterized protein (DUF433 family)